MLQTDAYSQYVTEEQIKIAGEARREVVKKLLAKLKESERTVMMLHYYGEMTCERNQQVSGCVPPERLRAVLQRAPTTFTKRRKR